MKNQPVLPDDHDLRVKLRKWLLSCYSDQAPDQLCVCNEHAARLIDGVGEGLLGSEDFRNWSECLPEVKYLCCEGICSSSTFVSETTCANFMRAPNSCSWRREDDDGVWITGVVYQRCNW